MQRRELLSAGVSLALAGCATTGAAQEPLRRIAFGSCNDQKLPQGIWDAVLAARPDLFLFGGDNVYCEEPFSPDKLQAAYALALRSPGFARVLATVPHMAVWDDHDFGLNDGGEGFAGKQASKDVFLSFWRAPADDPRRTREGLYDARVVGPPGRRVQVLLLDDRWFRSPLRRTDQRDAPGKERYLPDPDPRKTLLGEAQWRWLEHQLREPAEIRLVLSGIQVLAEGHGWERWGNLPLERERLFRLVNDTAAGGVVLLSGDQQIAIGGTDKLKLRKLWVDLFGLEVTGTFRSERENVDEDICAIGSGPLKVEVDLMQPLDPDKKPAVQTTPLNHVGLWIDDLLKAVAWLEAQGLRFAPGGIRAGAAGFDICFVHPKGNEQFPVGGEGVLIELVQAPRAVIDAMAALAQSADI